MGIVEDWEDAIENWASELDEDEWFFSKLRDSLTADLNPHDAFSAINDIVPVFLEDQNDYVSIEIIELVKALVKKSDTAEMPSVLKRYWVQVLEKGETLGDYALGQLNDLGRYYRL